jgi:hypothetical protein
MGFKEVTDLNADNATAIGGVNKKTGKRNPIQVEGYYLGKKNVEGARGPAALHIFQTETGNLGVWGKTDMNQKLENVVPGSMVRVSFSRMQSTPNGDMYKYKVEVDDTNCILVGNRNEGFKADNLYKDYTDEDTHNEDDAEEVEQHETVPAVYAKATNEERKAKAAAILSKLKK